MLYTGNKKTAMENNIDTTLSNKMLTLDRG